MKTINLITLKSSSIYKYFRNYINENINYFPLNPNLCIILIYIYMIKKENIQMIRKTIECNNHGGLIRYKCEYTGCQYPFLCAEVECFEEHFHSQNKLIISRFDSRLWESKCQEVQNVINNNSLKIKEEEMIKIMDFFTNSLEKIHQDMTQFEETKYSLCNSSQKRLNLGHFEKLDGFLCLGSKIQRKLDQLRAKIVDQDLFNIEQSSTPNPQNQTGYNVIVIPQKRFQDAVVPNSNSDNMPRDNTEIEINQSSNHSGSKKEKSNFNGEPQIINVQIKKCNDCDCSQNNDLTKFLRKHIINFSWEESQVIFSSKKPLTSCQRFHDKLKGISNLLFIFVGANKIIGSYFSQPYPTILERVKKDKQSFIFLQEGESTGKFIYFRADEQSQYHISISDKLLICHGNTPNSGDGLRTFQRNFESIAYFLPSHSFHSIIPDEQTTYSDVLKIKDFYILQTKHI